MKTLPKPGPFWVCPLRRGNVEPCFILDKNSFDSGFRSLGSSALPDDMCSGHGEPYVAFASCAMVLILSPSIVTSSSSTSIASLKARRHNWRLSWNLTWRCKAWGRCKSRNTLWWWWKAWRRIVETGWHEGLRSTISSL
jgi:hypothetical protein